MPSLTSAVMRERDCRKRKVPAATCSPCVYILFAGRKSEADGGARLSYPLSRCLTWARSTSSTSRWLRRPSPLRSTTWITSTPIQSWAGGGANALWLMLGYFISWLQCSWLTFEPPPPPPSPPPHTLTPLLSIAGHEQPGMNHDAIFMVPVHGSCSAIPVHGSCPAIPSWTMNRNSRSVSYRATVHSQLLPPARSLLLRSLSLSVAQRESTEGVKREGRRDVAEESC
jgi:hypothetical protein